MEGYKIFGVDVLMCMRVGLFVCVCMKCMILDINCMFSLMLMNI